MRIYFDNEAKRWQYIAIVVLVVTAFTAHLFDGRTKDNLETLAARGIPEVLRRRFDNGEDFLGYLDRGGGWGRGGRVVSVAPRWPGRGGGGVRHDLSHLSLGLLLHRGSACINILRNSGRMLARRLGRRGTASLLLNTLAAPHDCSAAAEMFSMFNYDCIRSPHNSSTKPLLQYTISLSLL